MDVRSLWILDSIIAFWEGWRLHCYASLCWFLLARSLCAVWWIVDIGFAWDPAKARLRIGHVCRVPEFNRSCLWHHGHDRWLWRCWVDTWLTLQHVIPKRWCWDHVDLTWCRSYSQVADKSVCIRTRVGSGIFRSIASIGIGIPAERLVQAVSYSQRWYLSSSWTPHLGCVLNLFVQQMFLNCVV